MFLLNSGNNEHYALCGIFNLNEGVLVSNNFAQPVQYILGGYYQQSCFKGAYPMLNTQVDVIFKEFSQPLPMVKDGWEKFTSDPGSFTNGLVPVLYSISILAVVTWFLTVFVVTNLKKSPVLLRISTTFALIHMLIVLVRSLIFLHRQQLRGYIDGQVLLSEMGNITWINATDLVVILLLQICQVQVIMRLFSRQSDKRIVFLAGVAFSVASQVLWGVKKIALFASLTEIGPVIPSLTYLLRIATNVIYATIFTAFVLKKLRNLIKNPSIWLITVLSVMLVYAPVAFFVADVTSSWAHEYSIVTYVVYQLLQRIQEQEGVLGRKFYEDEICELDRLGLFVEEEEHEDDSEDGPGQLENYASSTNTDDNDSTGKPDGSDRAYASSKATSSAAGISPTMGYPIRKSVSRIAFSSTSHPKSVHSSSSRAKSNIQKGYSMLKESFLGATDKMISIGLEIPQPSSKSSVTRHAPIFRESECTLENDFHSTSFRRHNRERGNGNNVSSPTRMNRDVFVHSTKNVELNRNE
ncbi:hypothetical protein METBISCDRAFT_29976 [Metschnikowia bicuspidata]|uniref:pH-response regulator protein palH/RIM21 n=1 Tax=Metschnikowia bicuspidata TaxID=27322 RepID=A0A4V1J3F0_9ASCO|nr:hypothetical protein METBISCDRAFT_29976 [Metschnikowia bicuspidata]